MLFLFGSPNQLLVLTQNLVRSEALNHTRLDAIALIEPIVQVNGIMGTIGEEDIHLKAIDESTRTHHDVEHRLRS